MENSIITASIEEIANRKLVDINAMAYLRFHCKKEKHQYFPAPAIRVRFPHKPINNKNLAASYHRSVIVKVSFNYGRVPSSAKAKAQAIEKARQNTKECIEYFFRFEDSTGFSKYENSLTKEAIHEEFDNDAVFKIMISPEDQNIDLKSYVRENMKYLEKVAGHKVKWTAVIHTNTEHRHAHILLSRTDGKFNTFENPLMFPKEVIRSGLRKNSVEISDRLLGKKNRDMHRADYEKGIKNDGPALIDYVIKGNVLKKTNLFIPLESGEYVLSKARMAAIPVWQRNLIEARLEYLAASAPETGIRKDHGKWLYLFEEESGWLRKLREKQRVYPFEAIATKYGPITILDRNNVPSRLEGTILAHSVADENNGRCDVVFKSKDDRLYLVNAEFRFSELSSLNGRELVVTKTENKAKGYQLPVVKVLPNNGVRR